MNIIVNDANILINLAELDLLKCVSELNIELHTNDFVMREVRKPLQNTNGVREIIKEQIRKVNALIDSGKLNVTTTRSEEYEEILNLQCKNLSFVDCSIWYQAKKINGTLLTGDNNLRQTVIASGVEVRGILYIFDILVDNQKITKEEAHAKLLYLKSTKARLPEKEVNKRLTQWSEEVA